MRRIQGREGVQALRRWRWGERLRLLLRRRARPQQERRRGVQGGDAAASERVLRGVHEQGRHVLNCDGTVLHYRHVVAALVQLDAQRVRQGHGAGRRQLCCPCSAMNGKQAIDKLDGSGKNRQQLGVIAARHTKASKGEVKKEQGQAHSLCMLMLRSTRAANWQHTLSPTENSWHSTWARAAVRRLCRVAESAGLAVGDLDHAAGAEHGVEDGAGGEGGEDAKGEALGGGIRALALQHAQHGVNQTALHSLAVVAVVGDHVAEEAQHGGGGGCGAARQHGAQGGEEGAEDRVVAAQVRQ